MQTAAPRDTASKRLDRRRTHGPVSRVGCSRFWGPHAGHPRARTPARPIASGQTLANDAGADLMVSLHCDRGGSEHQNGVATYHFGTGTGTTSPSVSTWPRWCSARLSRARTCSTTGCTASVGDPAADADAGRTHRARSPRLGTRRHPVRLTRPSSKPSAKPCWCRCSASTYRRIWIRRPAASAGRRRRLY